MKRLLMTTALVTGALYFGVPVTSANAALLFHGITYDLEEQATANPLVERFALKITGINDATDVAFDGGWKSNVNAIAFTPPTNFLSATMISPPTGFHEQPGGINSSGCDGSGGFFCFDNTGVLTNPDVPSTFGTQLPANSSKTFVFDVTISSGTFAAYNASTPSFKIDWVGFTTQTGSTPKHNFSLVSMPVDIDATCPDCVINPTADAPEPASLAMLGVGLLGTVAFALRRRA